ncbi:MAG: Crp/Fnr family transcriptional regulator [Anaerolineales bacterium]|nr:Crp/Fnr family transcriptional regulator [Anaerolineales bacterium]
MDIPLQDLLSRNRFFSLMDSALLEDASKLALKRSWPRNSFLSHYGDNWPYLFLVSKGQIDGVKESPEGRQLIVLSFKPGDLFWGLSFFTDDVVNPVALYARQNSKLYLWSRDNLLPLLLQSPQALWTLCQLMIQRMQMASQIVEGLAFQPVQARLARFLAGQFATTGERSIHRSLTLDEIAASIGTTREQACRALYQLADQQVIDITRTEFTLTDKDGLNQIAGG